MPLSTRLLRVSISMPSGMVLLDESLNIKVKIKKAALAIQNTATIDVIGLSKVLREALLSQFTAWNNRRVTAGLVDQNWVNVEIKAGWASKSANLPPSTVFKGQVVLCEPISAPPNVGVRLTCFTRQVDKTKFISDPAPAETTFRAYVAWAAGQMGFGSSYVCDTSFNEARVVNPSRSSFVASALLIDIQNMYRPDVAAFVDDDLLIVKDRNKIINPSQVSKLGEFIGIPTWNEWGVEFTCLYDQSVRLAQGVDLTSVMNPSLNGKYVVTALAYDLTSRDNPFYVTGSASPP